MDSEKSDEEKRSEINRELNAINDEFFVWQLGRINEQNGLEIYHYTNINALRNIIENKCFWLTKSNFLNDKTEYKYAIDLLKDIINEHQFSNYDFETKNTILEDVKQNLKRSYILSLSLNPDSVNLWANYSNQDGYNLKIDLDAIGQALMENEVYISGNNKKKFIVDNITDHNHSVLFYDGKVIYDRKDQKNEIMILLNELDCIFQKCNNNIRVKNMHGPNDTLKFKFSMVHTISSLLTRDIQLFKNPIFKDDAEYRILIDLDKRINAVKYRVKNNIIIPYIEFCFDTKILPITGITIGPKNNSDIAKAGLCEFLKSKGYKISSKKNKERGKTYIEKSQAPLRY